MNKKRMKEHLSSKFEDFVNSITDKKVRDLVKGHTIITGGCIVSLLLGENVSDYDLYFSNKATALAVAKYYVNIFNQNNTDRKNRFNYKHKAMVIEGGEQDFITDQIEKQGERLWKTAMLNIPEGRIKIVVRSDGVASSGESGVDPEKILTDMDDLDYEAELDPPVKKGDEKVLKYQPKFLTSTAVTLTDKIQCIIRFYGSPEEIHSNYDFIHCTNYWTSWNGHLCYQNDALEAIIDKRMVYRGSKYPLSSVIRMRKFLNKGWKINAGQILKMCFQLSQLDLTDPIVLEDQLIGVDTMYFMDLIYELEKKRNIDNNFVLDNHYISTLVDKIFG